MPYYHPVSAANYFKLKRNSVFPCNARLMKTVMQRPID